MLELASRKLDLRTEMLVRLSSSLPSELGGPHARLERRVQSRHRRKISCLTRCSVARTKATMSRHLNWTRSKNPRRPSLRPPRRWPSGVETTRRTTLDCRGSRHSDQRGCEQILVKARAEHREFQLDLLHWVRCKPDCKTMGRECWKQSSCAGAASLVYPLAVHWDVLAGAPESPSADEREYHCH